MNKADNKNKSGLHLSRQESYKGSIFWFILGGLSAWMALKGMIFFMENKECFLTETTSIFAVMSAFGVYLGASSFYRTRRNNKLLRNNMLPYNFDYTYELAVYKNIGDTKMKKKKICNMEISSFVSYTEWKQYILSTYIVDGSIIKSQLENFERFLNKKARLVRLEKEIVLSVTTPIVIGIVAIICSGHALKVNWGLAYIAVGMIEGVVVAAATMSSLHKYHDEECFDVDLIEIIEDYVNSQVVE